jgi:chemotaxis protein CheD
MEQGNIEVYEYLLNPGYIFIHGGAAVVRLVLGSAVAVTLWDRQEHIGGINHFIYPHTENRKEATARYGNVSMVALINFLLGEGAMLENLEAQIFGGASRQSSMANRIAEQNVEVARHILQKKNVPIVSEDVGGLKGRKVMYNLATNEAVVLKVDHLRENDWYPYESCR